MRRRALGNPSRSPLWVVFVVALALGAGCGGDDGETDPTVSSEAETSAGEASSPEVTDIEEAGAKRFRMPGDWLTADEESVWLSGASSVKQLDARTGRTLTTTKIAENPCLGSDLGYGAIWTATCRPGGLVRLDPETGEVTDRISIPGLPSLEGANGTIAAGAGGIWLVVDDRGCEDCRLVRVDPGTLDVEDSARLEAGSAGVVVAAGSVWVTNPIADVLQMVDPDREGSVKKIPVGEGPRFVAAGEGGVWTHDELGGSVTKVDPTSGEVIATITADELAGEGGDVAVGGGSVWIRTGSTLLIRIDPSTDQVVERFGPRAGNGGVAVTAGAVWLSAYDRDTVWRLPVSR